MPRQIARKTTVSGLTFVGSENLDTQLLELVFKTFLSGNMNLEHPRTHGELSEWIARLGDDPLGLIGWKTGAWGSRAGLAGKEFWLQAGIMLINPSHLKTGTSSLSPALNKITEQLGCALGVSDYKTADYVLELIGTDLEPDAGFNAAGIISALRAMQATCRCVARHHVLPTVLIEKAKMGDSEAALKLVTIDTLFVHDSCTKEAIEKIMFYGDRRFKARLARSIKHGFVPDRRGKDSFRLCLFTLFAMGFNIPMSSLHNLLDPTGEVFKGDYGFDRFVQRCRKEFRHSGYAQGPPLTGGVGGNLTEHL